MKPTMDIVCSAMKYMGSYVENVAHAGLKSVAKDALETAGNAAGRYMAEEIAMEDFMAIMDELCRDLYGSVQSLR